MTIFMARNAVFDLNRDEHWLHRIVKSVLDAIPATVGEEAVAVADDVEVVVLVVVAFVVTA